MRRLFRTGSLILLTTLFFISCSYEEIEFKNVNDTRVRDLANEKTAIVLNVRLQNPNGYNIKVVKADLDLFIGGTAAGKAVLTEKIKLRKRAEDDYDVIINVDKKEMLKAIAKSGLNILFSKSVQIKVKGWIKGRVFMFGRKFPVEIKHNVDLNNLKLN